MENAALKGPDFISIIKEKGIDKVNKLVTF